MKNNIIEKITKQLLNMEKLCKLVIIYGTLLSFCLFTLSATIYYYNNIYLNSYILMNNCIAMMKASVNIFAEVIIGGLLMDNVLKMHTN
ncbi:MAG: hypothetical protein ACM3UU_02580 [Ignavibacteriales bacterium]